MYLKCTASHIKWHLPVQEEADWLRLLLFENKYRKDSYITAFKKPCSFISHTSKTLVAHTLNTDCLAASNGVCTKEARPGLSCCYSKMKSIITHGHAYLST